MDKPALSLCLAPIRGVTDAAWRSAFSQLFGGFDDAVAPFFKPADGELKASALEEVRAEKNAALPVIPQLLVNRCEAFVHAAAQLEQIGATSVNWNLGCPMPTSTRKKLGSGFLPHTDEIDRFLDAVFSRVSIQISIKTRLGNSDPADLDRLIPVFNRYPLREVIIHPRVGTQQYEGSVNLDAFERICGELVHPVVYNGDICHPADLAQLQSRFPKITRWMIGRGALWDPFLPGAIRGAPPAGESKRRELLRTFHERLYADAQSRLSGFSHVHGRMMQIWSYLSAAVAAPDREVKNLRKVRNAAAYESKVRDIFGA